MAVQQARRRRPAGNIIDLRTRLKPAPMPAFVPPMLCTLVDKPFDSPDWIFEPKFDGLRILARFDGKKITLQSRNEKPQEFQFPDIVEALAAALKRPAL